MKLISILASMAALVGFSSAVIVDLYHDNNCQDFFYTIEVDPLTCAAPPAGFSSMIPRGDFGHLRVYSENNCAGSLGTEYGDEWNGRCAGFDTCNSLTYFSPYGRAGAEAPHPNYIDEWTLRRTRALRTLEAMGYEPQTMAEIGVTFAEDQDPCGHVTTAQYIPYFVPCWYRAQESITEFLSPEEYQDMIRGRSVIPVMKNYELAFQRQVKYLDALIAVYREEKVTPGTACLYSLKQQAIVAQTTGTTTWVNAKTRRPIDIRTLGGGWPDFYGGFAKKAQRNVALKEKFEKGHRPRQSGKQAIRSRI
ncbi:hypothetical protein SNOG_08574 [Paecilomyces variotii No. 5]|uniref:Uncharacterized protein n=1 Tax=Byssochlamys spectabilis (strain No. 5 / NBRC 109023) TaxID=1356009 RepID=V5FSH9_BYSSN|nr:hypothetical protein SNOG_08574 [Paecilomyces variotii No. 5]